MKVRVLGAACAIAVLLAGIVPALAQTPSAPGASAPSATAKPAPRSGGKKAKSTREPTVGQMAARERQKKCGAEWREAKAAGRTGGDKWPQYWSKCNARLKGNSA